MLRLHVTLEAVIRPKDSTEHFAVSDQNWWDDGTAVHISMVGFDNGTDPNRVLDGKPVCTTNPNLTAAADITTARRLAANAGVGFMGDTKGGPFDITFSQAHELTPRRT